MHLESMNQGNSTESPTALRNRSLGPWVVPTWQFRLTFALAALAMVFQVGGLGLKLHAISQSNLPILRIPSVSWLLLAITVLLLVNLVGICFRDRLGMLLSILSLLAIFLTYTSWFLITTADRQRYQQDPFYRTYPEAEIPHPLGLVEARWWSVVVLAIVVAIFALNIKVVVNRYLIDRKS